jgi:hypothetical protein
MSGLDDVVGKVCDAFSLAYPVFTKVADSMSYQGKLLPRCNRRLQSTSAKSALSSGDDPFLSLGVPGMHEKQRPVALGMRSSHSTFISIWRLEGSYVCEIPIQAQDVVILFLRILASPSSTRLKGFAYDSLAHIWHAFAYLIECLPRHRASLESCPVGRTGGSRLPDLCQLEAQAGKTAPI